jgi:glycosyltransferase involved in cell wall biosynthesis
MPLGTDLHVPVLPARRNVVAGQLWRRYSVVEPPISPETAARYRENGDNVPVPLVLWINSPSPYHEDLFRALLSTTQVDLSVVYDEQLPASRQQLGWQVSLTGYPNRSLSPSRDPRTVVWLAKSTARAVHIVNGLWSAPRFTLALATLITAGAPAVFIYSEASPPEHAKSLHRTVIKSLLVRLSAASPRTHLLAVSSLAQQQFISLGFPSDRIYPFGYFRSAPVPAKDPARRDRRLVYVGQLVRRKGIELLLEALAPLWQQFPSLTLDIVGEGPLRGEISHHATRVPHARVHLRGAVRSDQVWENIAQSDLLVLPTHFDGWGLVVNEALMTGTPVLVSDRCGAADLVEPGVNGYIFKAGSTSSLRDTLVQFLASPLRVRIAMRRHASRTGVVLSAETAAHYLLLCTRHALAGGGARPQPPWLAFTG